MTTKHYTYESLQGIAASLAFKRDCPECKAVFEDNDCVEASDAIKAVSEELEQLRKFRQDVDGFKEWFAQRNVEATGPWRAAFEDALDELAALSAYTEAQPPGEVVVTKHPDGRIVAVTRQDEEGRILSVIAKAGAPVSQPMDEQHTDDKAVDRFALVMKQKLAKKRRDGRSGWDRENECSMAFLANLLVGHVSKGCPVDIGNLAMMLHQREAALVERNSRLKGAASACIKNAWQARAALEKTK